MPTEKITCDVCEGGAPSLSPVEIEALQARIETLKKAIRQNDREKIAQVAYPRAPEKHYVGLGALNAGGREEEHTLIALLGWLTEAKQRQHTCEHCGGTGSLERRTLGWELIEGLVAVSPDGDGKEHERSAHRCRVPGGWMVKTYLHGHVSLTFVPDPDHTWEP
jgi:hypothetical protein